MPEPPANLPPVVQDRASRWTGRLVLGDGMIVYVGPGADADFHAHHAVQLVWSLGSAVDLRLDDRTHTLGAAIVAADVEHSFSGPPDPLALLLVEPHGPRGRALDAVARDLRGLDLTSRLGSIAPLDPTTDADVILRWGGQLVEILVDPQEGSPTTSVPRPEIRRVLEYIEGGLDGVPRLRDAAAVCGLSPSRLTHLFTNQVGIPFRRFVLWMRIKRAAEEVQGGRDLTAAAAAAGFADSAHFSRVFRANFGLPPSEVLPRLDIVGRFGPLGTD